MALVNRELRDINSSGELLDIFLTGVAEGDELLVKSAIQALIDVHADRTDDPHDVTKSQVGLGNVDNTSDSDKPLSTDQQTYINGKFGNYSFNANVLNLSDYDIISLIGSVIQLNKSDQDLDIRGRFIALPDLTIANINSKGAKSIITREWSLAEHYQKSAHISAFTGTPNQPIVTDLGGKIDYTLLPERASPQGNFTPTGGAEYPDAIGNVAGDYWVVDNVGAGYLFTGGDLSGTTVYESAWMVLDVNLNWFLANNYSGTVQTAWGSIIGTLSDQTDLNNALGLKANQTALDATNVRVTTNEADILALQGKVATDPGDSSATSMGQLVADYNTLLSNLRTAGLIA